MLMKQCLAGRQLSLQLLCSLRRGRCLHFEGHILLFQSGNPLVSVCLHAQPQQLEILMSDTHAEPKAAHMICEVMCSGPKLKHGNAPCRYLACLK